MNRERLIKVYRKLVVMLGIDSKDVVLSAGSAAVMLGVRTETKDLDVDIPGKDFDKLKNSGRYQIKTALDPNDELIVFGSTVDLHRGRDHRKTVEVEGVHIYSIDDLIEQKTRMADHPKRSQEKRLADLNDIDRLKALKAKPLSMKW